MYESYWKLNAKPFVQRIHPNAMYRGHSQQSARLRLKYCIDNGLGIAMLVGQAGVGKSSLAVSLGDDAYFPFVYLPFSLLQPVELLRMVAGELCTLETDRIPAESESIDRLLQFIRARILETSSQGKHALICFDDAHQMSGEVLRQVVQPILTLSDFQEDLNLSVVLSGHPMLSSNIRKHPQLADRVAVTAALHGFTLSEAHDYVRSALQQAGTTRQIFSDKAIDRLFEVTGGNPRRLNRLADMALLVGFADQLDEISENEIDAVSHELLPAAA